RDGPARPRAPHERAADRSGRVAPPGPAPPVPADAGRAARWRAHRRLVAARQIQPDRARRDGPSLAASRHVGPHHRRRRQRRRRAAAATAADEHHVTVVPRLAAGRVAPPTPARRFGVLDYLRRGEEATHPLLAGMGPEPLGPDFGGAYLSRALAGKMTPVKSALLDQRIVAGLGNIYVCEALYRAGVSPRRLAATVTGTRAARLTQAIRDVLTEAIE